MRRPKKPVIAVAGATGTIGQRIVRALITRPFITHFSEIVLLSRSDSQPSFPIAVFPAEIQLTMRRYDDFDLADSLADVDVLVNAIGPGPAAHAFKDNLLRALPDTPVRLYFPSEFGVDHRAHNFRHRDWDRKKAHCRLAAELLPSLRICRVFGGLVLERSVGPALGLDAAHNRFQCVGSAYVPVSFTSLADIGRTVASLALRPPENVPDAVHVAGDTLSVADIAGVMKSAGAGSITISEIDLKRYRAVTAATKSAEDPGPFLRFLMGEGSVDHSAWSMGCDNEMVNPGETLWRWKRMVDLAAETKGVPYRVGWSC